MTEQLLCVVTVLLPALTITLPERCGIIPYYNHSLTCLFYFDFTKKDSDFIYQTKVSDWFIQIHTWKLNNRTETSKVRACNIRSNQSVLYACNDRIRHNSLHFLHKKKKNKKLCKNYITIFLKLKGNGITATYIVPHSFRSVEKD